MNTNQYKIRRIRHTKIRDVSLSGGIYAAEYSFDKAQVIDAGDGHTAEFAYTESLYLVKLPDRQYIWIKPGQRRRIIEALEQLAPIPRDDESDRDRKIADFTCNTERGVVA